MDLVEGVDYYMDGGLMVFTAAYLIRRGYCCESHCRHCPYGLAPGAPVESFAQGREKSRSVSGQPEPQIQEKEKPLRGRHGGRADILHVTTLRGLVLQFKS